MYILSLTPHYQIDANWTEETNQHLGQHFNYLKTLFETGVMKHVGRTDMPSAHEDLHGYAIFEAADVGAATAIMNNDPAIVNGIMTAKLLPYIIVFS